MHQADPADRAAAEAHLATIADYAKLNASLRSARQAWPAELEAQLLDLAEALAGRGERALASTHAQTALATARVLDAAPLERQAESLLDRLGSTQRADGLLTRREREVLTLIAQGHTNGQIAAALFMSPKTASVHVSRITTKLGAANRTQASAIARQTGLVTA